MKPNFAGWVSKANTLCTDGRTIKPGAFEHQDGATVPLIFQHKHDDINQVLGKVVLSHKDEGVWGEAYVDETPQGTNADKMVKNGSLDKFSIWAKNLVERGSDVMRGDIKEVSLVLAGANPGAVVEDVMLAHSAFNVDDDMVVVGGEIVHDDGSNDSEKKEESEEGNSEKEESEETGSKTVGNVLGTIAESLNDEQRAALNQFISDVAEQAVTDALTEQGENSSAENTDGVQHSDTNSQEGNSMSKPHNIFESGERITTAAEIKHDDIAQVFKTAKAGNGRSLRETARELLHAQDYGVQNIEVLFPDAQALMKTPVFVDRRQEWVKVVMGGIAKSPFSRVKTMHADITADEARARGHIRGDLKIEEVFPIFKRVTGPTMIYKKQKLDRQDILEVTSFDIVAWVKAEMRGKLDEELARAAIFGDGRGALADGKIPSPTGASGDGIRSVVGDDPLYTEVFEVPMDAVRPTQSQLLDLVDVVAENREHYRGSNNITGLISFRLASRFLTQRDAFGRRIYKNLSELANDLEVNQLVRVPTELFTDDAVLVLMDLSDYNFGTNAGGEVTLFSDFDIDYNQEKYLLETYLSGANTLPYSAQVYKRTDADELEVVTPGEPVMVDNVITIPDTEGVIYTVVNTMTEVEADEEVVVPENTTIMINATPAPGFEFTDGKPFKSWNFTHVPE